MPLERQGFNTRNMGSGIRAPSSGQDITITESDGYIVATDEDTGISSQGETKEEALENLAEALRLHRQPTPPEEEPASDAPWF